MNYYMEVLKKYATFGGRARRAEYWMFTLINVIIAVVVAFVSAKIGMAWLYMVYAIGVLLPSLAVGIRRLHDTGRSGWYLFIALIPLIGAIVLLVWMIQDSQPGDNQYGSNPKAA
jgi:uncharacterized membrane protein YhaH (DUF805 family)